MDVPHRVARAPISLSRYVPLWLPCREVRGRFCVRPRLGSGRLGAWCAHLTDVSLPPGLDAALSGSKTKILAVHRGPGPSDLLCSAEGRLIKPPQWVMRLACVLSMFSIQGAGTLPIKGVAARLLLPSLREVLSG